MSFFFFFLKDLLAYPRILICTFLCQKHNCVWFCNTSIDLYCSKLQFHIDAGQWVAPSRHVHFMTFSNYKEDLFTRFMSRSLYMSYYSIIRKSLIQPGKPPMPRRNEGVNVYTSVNSLLHLLWSTFPMCFATKKMVRE